MQSGGADGPVKIGYARDPEKRRRDLQCAHPHELRLIRVVEGGYMLEGWLRERFGAGRLRGEWHRFDPEMLTVEISGAEEAHRLVLVERNRDRARARGRAQSKTWKTRAPGLEGFSPETRRSYDKVWRAFVRWRGMGESLPISDVQVETFLDSKTWPGKRVKNILAALSGIHVALGHDRISLRPGIKAWLRKRGL